MVGMGDGPNVGERANAAPDNADGAEFASRQAARGKMQMRLTAFTALAALVILLVVSMSVLRPH
jgi:hypothetical protein